MSGLEHRYDVRKINDPTGKHANCGYFVLDPQHDELARIALACYASAARDRGMVALADDLDLDLGTIRSRFEAATTTGSAVASLRASLAATGVTAPTCAAVGLQHALDEITQLIAAARTDVPALVAEVERLRDTVARVEALAGDWSRRYAVANGPHRSSLTPDQQGYLQGLADTWQQAERDLRAALADPEAGEPGE